MLTNNEIGTSCHLECPPPETAPSEPSARPARPGVVSASSEHLPLSILLADDNEINQYAGLRLLQGLDCFADVANDGNEVLEILAREPYDVLLLDIHMPFFDGFTLAQRIRHRERMARLSQGAQARPPLVIIALTADATAASRERLVTAEINDCLLKPIDVACLPCSV